jgi:hypothetical protein
MGSTMSANTATTSTGAVKPLSKVAPERLHCWN